MKSCYHIKLSPSKIAIADLTDYYDEGKIITRINVPEEFRGQGYGTQLLDLICKEADEYNVRLYLEIQATGPLNNDQLEAWYKKRGFRGFGMYVRRPQRKESNNEYT